MTSAAEIQVPEIGSVEAELEALLPSPAVAWPSVKCDYIKKNGKQCGQWAYRGATKCVRHGANLPLVRRAAENRVLAARILLMRSSGKVSQKLIDISLGKCDATAHQVTAARAVLDRAGLAPVTRTVSDVTVHVKPDGVDDDIERLMARRDGSIEADAVELGEGVPSPDDEETEDA